MFAIIDMMNRMIPRVIDDNPIHEAAIATMMIYSVGCDLNKIDAIVVFPGMGEEWRLLKAVKIWNKHRNITRLLVGGMYRGEGTYTEVTIETLRHLSTPIQREAGVIFQDTANYTKQQTDWVVEQISKYDISNVGLIISPYHLLRAYCTLIHSMKEFNHSYIPIIPIPVQVAPSVIIPETGVDAWRMASGEYERMEKYQQKGDVATYDEVRGYLAWLWKSPIVKDNDI